MTLALRVCRCCDRLITEPEDAVPVGYELGMFGPGWIVWAHSEHPLHVEPDAMPRNILARLLITRALQPDD
ncbi:hypothetical protein [Streptomyces sp. NPDC058398]|uniref:hypothetical protein n=1 Tax=Streptomyces sp. NPDC058398 TaxID=3346479 RepID=UPI0036462162